MSFCQNCGAQVQDGAPFCPSCGTAQNAAPVNNGFNGGMPNNMPGNMPGYYVKPKIPGRGAGIAGMVLGIIGLVYSFYCLALGIEASNSFYGFFDDSIIVTIVIFSVLSILGVSLAASGRSKGYRCGISAAGIATGCIGLALYLIAIILVAAA